MKTTLLVVVLFAAGAAMSLFTARDVAVGLVALSVGVVVGLHAGLSHEDRDDQPHPDIAAGHWNGRTR